jgi:hypothetical protein
MNEGTGSHQRGAARRMGGLTAALAGTVLLATAACMRAHGYPGFPDPGEQDGHLVRPPLPASIDISSPRFQSTQEACNKG